MKTDPIVAEVRKSRQKILESYGWDFDKMSQDVMKRQWNSGRKVVTFDGRKSDGEATPQMAEPEAQYGAGEQAK
jgi:hypothetical protein